MLCVWEVNRRSGVALAMHASQTQQFIHLWAQGLRKGDEQLSIPPTLIMVMAHFTFYGAEKSTVLYFCVC